MFLARLQIFQLLNTPNLPFLNVSYVCTSIIMWLRVILLCLSISKVGDNAYLAG